MKSQDDDDQCKFILVYQNHLTKFVQLRPLKSKVAEEAAYVLLDIFTNIGAPSEAIRLGTHLRVGLKSSSILQE